MSGRIATVIERMIVDAARQGGGDAGEIFNAIEQVLNKTGNDAAPVIAAGILDGIRRASDRLDRVRVAVTGTGWVGGGVGSVEETLMAVIKQARQEILGTAYTITPGSSRIIEQLEHAAATGVKTRLIIDHFDEQQANVKDRLRSLARNFPSTVTLYEFAGPGTSGHLHAKTVVVDRRVAVVGSANLTFHGMMTAHELAVIVEGPAAEQIASRIDLLSQFSNVKRLIT